MYLLPSPAEDEFSLGYLGRLAHLNNAKSANAFIGDLAKSFGLNAFAGAWLKALAQAAGSSCTDFLRAHTIAPALVCGKDVSHGLVGGNIYYPCPDQRNPMKLPESKAYLCEPCVSEQREKYGFGYWHRVHQLPGVYWCPWHMSPLVQCEGRYVSEKLPFWSFEVTEASAQVRRAIDHPILNRYNEVIMGFLNGSGPIAEWELIGLLMTKAEQKGINTSMWASAQPFLSDIAFDTVPHWWLRDAVTVSEKSPGKFFVDIDDAVCAGRVGTRAYALAAAIIFDGETCDVSAARRDKRISCLD